MPARGAVSEEKQRIRRAERTRRRECDSAYWREVGQGISRRLTSLLKQREPQVLGSYRALADEPVLEDFDWSTAFPRVEGEAIRFHRCELGQLRAGAFGIEEPPVGSEEVQPQMVLVPGLAFGEDGSRLGRGKGYYDRYLASHHTLAVGVVDEAGLYPSLPREAHDERVDVIVTEARVLMRKDDHGLHD